MYLLFMTFAAEVLTPTPHQLRTSPSHYIGKSLNVCGYIVDRAGRPVLVSHDRLGMAYGVYIDRVADGEGRDRRICKRGMLKQVLLPNGRPFPPYVQPHESASAAYIFETHPAAER